MIRIYRGEPPHSLEAGAGEAGRELAPASPGQWNSDVLESLGRDSNNKCSFCESQFSNLLALHATHYRPPRNTLASDGTLRHDHYTWLEFEWTNLLAACSTCISARGTRFPTAETHSEVGARGAKLDEEQPLLIDPSVMDPASVLVQHSNGRLISADPAGLTTIETFNLNRQPLVEQRQRAVEQLRAEWTERLGGDVDEQELTDWLRYQTSGSRPFAGQRRQVLRLWAKQAGQHIEALLENVEPVADVAPWTHEAVQAAEDTYSTQNSALGSYSLRRASTSGSAPPKRGFAGIVETATGWFAKLTRETTVGGYFVRSHNITRVELENVRSFESISFEIPRADEVRAPWTMFLGENATGKSTILQAVAACLAGKEEVERLKIRPDQFLRDGAERGIVRVHLSGPSKALEMAFRRGDSNFEFSDPEPKVLVLGYGATRLLPRGAHESKAKTPYARVSNLFDPFEPTIDAAAWLLSQSQDEFERLGAALGEALDMTDGAEFVRDQNAGTVSLCAFGTTVELRSLSDGYQSIIGTVVDIVSILRTRWPSIEVAEGIVLIDELGSHLHPQWKTRIVHGLRRSLPRVQFLVSTHDPLCIHGVDTREIVLLERDDQGTIAASNDLQDIDEMTIDQVLRTRLFKLPTTRGLTAVENYERAARLMRRSEAGVLSEPETNELETLRARLGGPLYVERQRAEGPSDEEIESWVRSDNPALSVFELIGEGAEEEE